MSEQRKECVRVFAKSRYIAVDRLLSEGSGDTQPVADNKTAQGKAKPSRRSFGHPIIDKRLANFLDNSSFSASKGAIFVIVSVLLSLAIWFLVRCCILAADAKQLEVERVLPRYC